MERPFRTDRGVTKLLNEKSHLLQEVDTERLPFTGYPEILGFPDPRRASLDEIKSVIRQIIEKDGPLTLPSLYRLYIQGCPRLKRAGKGIQKKIRRVLSYMKRNGEIFIEDELGIGADEGIVVRLQGTPRVRFRPRGKRDFLEIPPSELMEVLREIRDFYGEAFWEDLDSVGHELLKRYGFKRLTRPRVKYIERILKLFKRKVQEIP